MQVFILKKKDYFFYLTERATQESTNRGSSKMEGEVDSPVNNWAGSLTWGWIPGPWNPTWVETKSLTLNQLSPPGSPEYAVLY